MTTAAICATREVLWSPSFYRAEQYDSDLGLYYLRARYMNPVTGRFMSRDPGISSDDDDDWADEDDMTDWDGNDLTDPSTLHKYSYSGADPVNFIDPSGQSATIEDAEIIKLGGLALATGVAIYNYEQHADQTEGALRQLGATIGCVYTELGSEFFSWVQVGLEGDGDAGTVSRVGPCAFSYKPHRTGKNKGKHQKGERRRGKDYGGEKGDKGYPNRPPGDRKGPGEMAREMASASVGTT
jgi:RHS repeat-associated protein